VVGARLGGLHGKHSAILGLLVCGAEATNKQLA
jgi:hypothetical protein